MARNGHDDQCAALGNLLGSATARRAIVSVRPLSRAGAGGPDPGHGHPGLPGRSATPSIGRVLHPRLGRIRPPRDVPPLGRGSAALVPGGGPEDCRECHQTPASRLVGPPPGSGTPGLVPGGPDGPGPRPGVGPGPFGRSNRHRERGLGKPPSPRLSSRLASGPDRGTPSWGSIV